MGMKKKRIQWNMTEDDARLLLYILRSYPPQMSTFAVSNLNRLIKIEDALDDALGQDTGKVDL